MTQRPATLTRRDVIQSGLRLGGTMMASTALVQGTAVAVTMDPLSGSAKADKTVARSDAARTVIALPEPQKEGGLPLMQALALRRTTRTFADKPLSQQQLSNLLWAAFGTNRADGRRTAPSAWNWQEIDIYLTTSSGAYLYLAASHSLRQVVARGVRAAAGVFPFVRTAATSLVYVADRIEAGGLARATRQAQPLQRGGRGLHHPERLPVLCLGRVGGSRLRRHRQGCAGPNAQDSAGDRRSSWRRPSAIHRWTQRRSRMARCPSRSQMLQSQDGAMLLHDSQERAPLVEAGAACRGPPQ